MPFTKPPERAPMNRWGRIRLALGMSRRLLQAAWNLQPMGVVTPGVYEWERWPTMVLTADPLQHFDVAERAKAQAIDMWRLWLAEYPEYDAPAGFNVDPRRNLVGRDGNFHYIWCLHIMDGGLRGCDCRYAHD